MQKQKISHHLWGVKKPYTTPDGSFLTFRTWEYTKPCTADRRAITGLDHRKYSQLEIREENTGRVVENFAILLSEE